jgi:Ala-tRNA(Pro) deacylase
MTAEQEPAAQVYEALQRLGIAYERIDHPPAFTAEEALQYWATLDAAHCKNLFVRNKKGDRHCLIVVPVERAVDLLELSKTVGGGRLSFASAERLAQHLGLTPGSVSPFGLLNDPQRKVDLFVDAALRSAARLAFHPNINTSTLAISFVDFERFLRATGHVARYVAF